MVIFKTPTNPYNSNLKSSQHKFFHLNDCGQVLALVPTTERPSHDYDSSAFTLYMYKSALFAEPFQYQCLARISRKQPHTRKPLK